MNEMILTQQHLTAFAAYLGREEKSRATIEKYLRDASAFRAWTAGRPVTKELVVAYKHRLVDLGYAVRSVNSMLASVNSLLGFLAGTTAK